VETTRMTIGAQWYCKSEMTCENGERKLATACASGSNVTSPACSLMKCDMLRLAKHYYAHLSDASGRVRKKVIHTSR